MTNNCDLNLKVGRNSPSTRIQLNKVRILTWLFIIAVIGQIGLLFPIRSISEKISEIDAKRLAIEKLITKIKTFDDSISADTKFRRRLLDSLRTIEELKGFQISQKTEMARQLSEFKVISAVRPELNQQLRIYNALRVLLGGTFVALGLYLFNLRYGRG